MTTGGLQFIGRLIAIDWLAGPIFAKELRVSSRRRRNYVLRVGYLALLTLFVVLVWLATVSYRGSGAMRASRMAEAGKEIIATLVWFQFYASQLVAIIMLSTSISDEIYHRTLAMLMTTPINSFQIVMGKLLSKLLQLVLLLAITVPLLAIVRVFGGVPWDFVIGSLGITLCALVFVGSLSLFCSIFTRRAYVVIIMTLLTMGVVFFVIPFLIALSWHAMDWDETVFMTRLLPCLFHANPYGTLGFRTQAMMSAGAMGGMTISVPIHCGIMLGAAALILLLAVRMVRKVGLRQASGQAVTFSDRRRERKQARGQSGGPDRIRRVKGSATLWKEWMTPIFGRHKVAAIIIIILALMLLALTYLLVGIEEDFDDEEVHMAYVAIFLGLGMLFTIVLPATCITSEKESRSWPLLLGTTLSDRRIIVDKFLGALRRCLPIWILLFAHVIVFAIVGSIHPIAIIQIAILAAWVIVFFIGSGLYFSTRFRRTTTAVIMNFALGFVIWAIVPLLLVLASELSPIDDDYAEGYVNAIPFFQAVVVMDATSGGGNPADDAESLSYRWENVRPWQGGVESTYFMLWFMIGYMVLAFVFAWRAKCRLRRNVF